LYLSSFYKFLVAACKNNLYIVCRPLIWCYNFLWCCF